MDDKAEEARLLAIAAAVSEGADVDWERAARASESARSQRVLRALQLIDGIARVHRSELPDDHGHGHEPHHPDDDHDHVHNGGVLSAGLETLDTNLPSSRPSDWAHLHILKEIGQGAFGTVYRAWDPRLEREVALKLLSAPSLARGALLLREARLLARVRHANVVTVYGAEEIDERIGIWMESVRGATLDSLLHVAGRLGPQEAALVGLALCRALAAVHAAGLVHRDVKARNVMREEGGRIVLMDFGAGSDLATTRSESIGPAGTPLYMAPEIFDGARPTPAADIYSLGVLLYHLVTQSYPVNGRTKGEIHDTHRRGERRRLRDARPDLPEAFVQAVDRALHEDPAKRHESAGAFEEALAAALGGGHDPHADPEPREPLPWWRRWMLPAGVAAVALAAGAIGTGLWMAGRKPPVVEAPRARFDIFGPHQASIESVSISPDGSHVAFVSQGQLWVRALDSLEPRALPGTGGANLPFWSPDGHDIAFFSGTKLKRVALSGDEPRTLCEARRPRGGTWSPRGVILFSTGLGAQLQEAPAEGGEPSPVMQPDTSRGDREIDWPTFLPDGAHYFYVARSRDPERSGVFVARLPGVGTDVPHVGATTTAATVGGSNTSGGVKIGPEGRRLLDVTSNVVYAAGSIVYARRGTMFARPFDLSTMRFTGQPVTLAERVDVNAFDDGYAEFSASRDGQVVYRGGVHPDRELRWFDRDGKQLSIVAMGRQGEGNVGEYRDFALSPDASRLAYDQLDPHTGRRDVWVLDLFSGGTIRLTFDPDDDGTPVWSPDGRSLIFASNRGGQFALYRKAADGSGGEERLFDAQAVPLDWSRDGKLLVYEVFEQKTGTDLFMLPVGVKSATPRVFLQTEFMEREPQFSPDTRWMAYSSSESSQRQIYLQPVATGDPLASSAFVHRWQVSPGYGREPRWRADGRELFYIGPDETLTAVSITLGSGTVKIGPPRPLFRLRITGSDVRQHYAVAPDGQRFLVNTLVEGVQPSPMTLLINALSRPH